MLSSTHTPLALRPTIRTVLAREGIFGIRTCPLAGCQDGRRQSRLLMCNFSGEYMFKPVNRKQPEYKQSVNHRSFLSLRMICFFNLNVAHCRLGPRNIFLITRDFALRYLIRGIMLFAGAEIGLSILRMYICLQLLVITILYSHFSSTQTHCIVIVPFLLFLIWTILQSKFHVDVISQQIISSLDTYLRR